MLCQCCQCSASVARYIHRIVCCVSVVVSCGYCGSIVSRECCVCGAGSSLSHTPTQVTTHNSRSDKVLYNRHKGLMYKGTQRRTPRSGTNERKKPRPGSGAARPCQSKDSGARASITTKMGPYRRSWPIQQTVIPTRYTHTRYARKGNARALQWR